MHDKPADSPNPDDLKSFSRRVHAVVIVMEPTIEGADAFVFFSSAG